MVRLFSGGITASLETTEQYAPSGQSTESIQLQKKANDKNAQPGYSLSADFALSLRRTMDAHAATPADDVASQMDLDLDLTERVSRAVDALDMLRGTRAHVDVSVSQGHVTLEGVVQSPMAAAEVENTAAYVSGGAPITNRLTNDSALSSAVAKALATDARTASIPPGYQVASVYGHLSLVGVFTPEQVLAVQAVAQGMPGARSVTVKAL